jgi:peptidoglycan hydrolase-like protein with peptidoglycan-binding domain
VDQWFQNTRGLVIVVLAIITGAVLLAIEPGDGFPTGAGISTSSGDGTTVTTTATTAPKSTTTTTVARPTLQEGTPDTGNTTTLQTRLKQLGYDVTIDGSFGGGTTAAVKAFQTNNKLPANGVVDQATWNALSSPNAIGASGAATTATTAATTTTTKP